MDSKDSKLEKISLNRIWAVSEEISLHQKLKKKKKKIQYTLESLE